MTLVVGSIPIIDVMCVAELRMYTATLQRQYTKGNHAIVKWAPIVNAHVLYGPDIITALAEAARKAIAAHNSSVSTDISASPAPSVVGGGLNGDDEDDTEDEDSGSPVGLQQEPDERNSRKRSVVSVSTTISMKSEAISPEPSLRPTLSRESTEESEESEAEDLETQLENLGPPPFYRSLLLLAQASTRKNRFTAEYTSECVEDARANRDFVMGFIAQESLNSKKDDNFITMTPGVQLAAGSDSMGQQYNTPRRVITEAGSDIIIVGRGVYAASDRRRAAMEYRKQGWTAYEERLRAGQKQQRR